MKSWLSITCGVLVVLLATSTPIQSAEPVGGQDTETPDGVGAAAVDGELAASPDDPQARRYLNTCAGCHLLEGAKLNGPALSHVATWPREQLEAAIRRMEKNVGPLSPADLELFVSFLQAPDNRTRLAAEQERVRAQFARTLAPPDAALGERLFRGGTRLENGGLACFACHRFGAEGGRLGPDLSDAGIRLGKAPLLSGITGAAYKVMAPHYQKHPITAQEAAHLAEFLSSPPSAGARPATNRLLLLGGGGASLAFLGLAAYFGRGRKPRGTARTRAEV